MTFGKPAPRRPKLGRSQASSLSPRPRRGGAGLVVRALLLGSVAIAGAAWALVRHYTHEPPPMRVPVPSAAPTYDADAGEVPVPELLETGR